MTNYLRINGGQQQRIIPKNNFQSKKLPLIAAAADALLTITSTLTGSINPSHIQRLALNPSTPPSAVIQKFRQSTPRMPQIPSRTLLKVERPKTNSCRRSDIEQKPEDKKI